MRYVSNSSRRMRLVCAALSLVLILAGCGGGGSNVSVTLTATPLRFLTGEVVTLQWQSVNANAVVSSNFNAVEPNGAVQVTPATATTYEITVGNGRQTARASVLVVPLGIPPQPQSSHYSVQTPNYADLYGQTSISHPPFSMPYRLLDAHYPLTLSYESIPSPPWGFNLQAESELMTQVWAQADARVCIISGVSPSQARVKVKLVETITYNGMTNIIGLAKAYYSSQIGAHYEVLVATVDPLYGDGRPMPYAEMQRTLTHELGHVIGLGHADNQRDVMHYQSNGQQGHTPSTFLTFGDAMAIWTTLSRDHIHWYPERPTIAVPVRGPRIFDVPDPNPTVTDDDGVVICVVRAAP